nr:MarR family winged helix-turn-helix transcriptional regulator [Kandeliimicrobium roseum]
MGRFLAIWPETTVQQVQIFSWIALNEGRTQRDLRAALDLPSSSASRNIALLSKLHRLGKPGMSLIEWVDDPEDRRAKLLQLTQKGHSLVANILDDLR